MEQKQKASAVVTTQQIVNTLPKRKFIHATEFVLSSEHCESKASELPSITVPDQAMSIREILRRYASGLPLDGERVPFYEFDENQNTDEAMPDFSRMDKVDIEMYAKELKIEKDRLKEVLALEAKQAKEKADALAKIQRTTGEKGDQGSTDQPDNNPGPKAKLPAEGERQIQPRIDSKPPQFKQ